MKRRDFLKSTFALSAGAAVLPVSAAEKESFAFDRETDLLVMGAGFAGLSAAVTAARAGLKVLVLEKRRWIGGDGILSAGIIISARTPLHDAAGITKGVEVEDYWKRIESGLEDEPLSKVRDNLPLSEIYSGIAKHNPEVLHECAKTSPRTVAFIRSYGIEFRPINPAQPFLLPSMPGSMAKFNQGMQNELKKAVVEILTRTPVIRLITENGRVIGAEAKRGSRSTFIRAKAVLAAAGGFSDNMDLMRRYKRVWADVPKGFTAVGAGVPDGHDGDAIQLGRKVGAAIEDMESLPKFFAAPKEGQVSPSWILFDTDTAYLVDQKGNRFVNEKEARYAGCALKCFHKKIDGAYVVTDEATVTGPNAARWRYAQLIENKGLFKGNTIEEAARAAGVDPEGLKAQIEKIAKNTAAGTDEFGRKDPLVRPLKAPFYVSTPSYPVRFKTEGGLEVTPSFEVMAAADDQPIPGFYAAGACCGSISTRLSDVIGSGLLAGDAIVKAVKA